MSLTRNFDFLKARLIIALKVLKEYKVNAYTGFAVNALYMGIVVLAFFTLKKQFPDIFYWKPQEFVFFMIIMEIFIFISHPWFRKLREELLTGNFSQYLLRPLNTTFYYAASTFDYTALVAITEYIIFFMIYITFFIPVLNIPKLSLTLMFALFGSFLFISVTSTIDSLAFFIKQNRFLSKSHEMVGEIFSKYPASFFKGGVLEKLSYFIAYAYFTSFATDFYFGYISIGKFVLLWGILICLTTAFTLISILLWKYGLKKYEAFG